MLLVTQSHHLVQLVLPGKRKTRDLAVAVGKEALLLIDDKSGQPLQTFEYATILSWAAAKEVFSLKVSFALLAIAYAQ